MTKRFKQVVDGVEDTRTGRTLTYPLDFMLKLNELNGLYDYVFDMNEQLEKENWQLKQQTIEKQKHIINLEGKIHRMRKQIRKLEELYHYRSADLKRENDKLKRQIVDIDFCCTQNRIEFDKDSLHIKDTHTEIDLKNRNIYISVFIPQIKEYFRFNYMVTGRRLSRELINYSKE